MALPAPPTGAPRRPPRVPRPEPVPRARSPRLAALAAAPGGAADFWRTVGAEGTPLVEPDPDGDPAYAVVTFLWRGGDGTRAVLVLPNKVMDPRDPAGNLCERIPGTDVWHWSVRMRRDWRATYALCVDAADGPDAGDGPDGDRPGPAAGAAYWTWLRGRPRPDPLNARRFPRRWGGAPLSVVELPDAPGAAGWTPRTAVPAGTVSRHTLPGAALGGGRTVWAYEPPGAAGARELPVLVLFDGEMWQPGLSVSVLLDNLIADGRIPPVLALLPESADSDTRWSELACGEAFTDFLEHELLPWAGVDPLDDGRVDPGAEGVFQVRDECRLFGQSRV
ncbi:enterochelin esterase domain-containing protein, partial [Streptomyces sp. NPDC048845]|uniref:enterochelin esterase domain-containing protein n=1 Tax=Streptomyces sp. NPDC048845 TaxID=3155390 RepID=UPI00342546F4